MLKIDASQYAQLMAGRSSTLRARVRNHLLDHATRPEEIEPEIDPLLDRVFPVIRSHGVFTEYAFAALSSLALLYGEDVLEGNWVRGALARTDLAEGARVRLALRRYADG